MRPKSTTTINATSTIRRLSIFSFLFFSILLFFATTESILNNFYSQKYYNQTDHESNVTTTNKIHETTTTTYPKWFEPISKPFRGSTKQPKIAVVNMEGLEALDGLDTLHANITHVRFKKVSPTVTWRDLYPLWIDEALEGSCPDIPMPDNVDKYKGMDVVIAKLPCGNWSQGQRVGIRDVYRLQVSLVVAKVVAESGNKEVSVVVVSDGECEPMWEIFKCDGLVWHQGSYWVFKPDVLRLKHKVLLPVGACKVAPQPYNSQPGLEHRKPLTTSINNKQIREAYVTVLHSSELYVCGAITLAQSILETNTTRDLVLLADDTISVRSIQGLKAAGWRIKRIKRVRCPSAKKGHYNEWNCSKLRIWQLIEYTKVIFIDADFIVLKNIDQFFTYPQLSAVEDTMSIFNSGFMIVEPSRCFFNMLMVKRYTLHSYNGGDQGLLNEAVTWWHRLRKKIIFLKCFMNEIGRREVPNEVYMIHFVGVKPWVCYRDYDCNWDQEDRHIFASDVAHSKWWQVYDALPNSLRPLCGLTNYMDANIKHWRQLAKLNVNFTDSHWKMNVKDPRQYNLTDNL